MAEASNDFPTTIGADASFKGQLEFEKGVRLLGKFEGEISSEGQMVIAEGAKLNGNVKAGTIRVDGQVTGNLDAGAKIQLSASARLEGDVQTQRLEVAEGAVLVGRCIVGVNGAEKGRSEVKSASKPAEVITPPRSKMAAGAPAGAK